MEEGELALFRKNDQGRRQSLTCDAAWAGLQTHYETAARTAIIYAAELCLSLPPRCPSGALRAVSRPIIFEEQHLCPA